MDEKYKQCIKSIKQAKYSLDDGALLDAYKSLMVLFEIGTLPEYLKYHEAISKGELEIKDIPMIYLTYELCMDALRNNGLQLRDIPEFYDRRFQELIEAPHSGLCFEAVKQNGLALEFVPSKYRTLQMCTVAFNQNKDAVKYFNAF